MGKTKKNQRAVEKGVNDNSTDKKVSDTMTMEDCNDDGQQQQPTEPAAESGLSTEDCGEVEKTASDESEKDTMNNGNNNGSEEQTVGDDKLDDTAECDEARDDGEHASPDDSMQEDSQELDANSDDNDADEANEEWDLKKVMSIEELTNDPIECETKGCTLTCACVYVSNKGKTWNTCLDCQDADYGGWPEHNSEIPLKFMTDEHKTVLISKCSSKKRVVMPEIPDESGSGNEDFTREIASPKGANSKTKVVTPHTATAVRKNGEQGKASANNESMEEGACGDSAGVAATSDADEEEETWVLKKVMSIEELSGSIIKCGEKECMLAAACLYVSNEGEKWYGCLDCQEEHYGGWPDDPSEMPITSMSDEHKAVLIAKCSSKKQIAMPKFPASPSKNDFTQTVASHTVTPLATGAAQTKTVASQTGARKPNKQSASIAIHRKWQEAAEARGGPGTRICVSKPEAKKLIFDYLFDAFAPKNISQIYEDLKAVVPSPVLKSSLEDMVRDKTVSDNPFDDSDDEDDDGAKKPATKQAEPASSDLYAGSLTLKAGKSPNSTLYYVNYNKAKNGNGLDSDELNELLAQVAKSEAEEQALKAAIQQKQAETKKLLSEPTNEEATALLQQKEATLAELKEKVDEARKHMVNEKDKNQLKRRITNMTSQWRKRRRICMQFLIGMEEMTEGTITVKKALNADTPLDIDSDEQVAKSAIAFAKKKRENPTFGKKRALGAKKPNKSAISGIPPSEDFVAVMLDSQGCVKRVFVDDAEDL